MLNFNDLLQISAHKQFDYLFGLLSKKNKLIIK